MTTFSLAGGFRERQSADGALMDVLAPFEQSILDLHDLSLEPFGRFQKLFAHPRLLYIRRINLSPDLGRQFERLSHGGFRLLDAVDLSLSHKLIASDRLIGSAYFGSVR
jgi:hypothetical protein